MYAAIRQYEFSEGSIEDYLRIVEEGFTDALSSQPGFLGYHVVANGVSFSGSEQVVALTFFDDEESAARSNEMAAEFAKEHLHGLNLTMAMSGPIMLSRTAPAAVTSS